MPIKGVTDTFNQDMVSSRQIEMMGSTQNLKSINDRSTMASIGTTKDNSQDDNNGKQLVNPFKQLETEINKANNQLHFRGTKCEFKYFEDINRVAIKVIDKETEEVIREIPPEDTIKLIQKLWEFAGLLYDEKG